jgi:transcriptional regulator with XRE-family HTH domain
MTNTSDIRHRQDVETTGDRIRQIRERRGYSVNQLTARCFFSSGAVSRQEKRLHPRPDTVQIMAAALNVDLQWLTTGVGQPSEQFNVSDLKLTGPQETIARLALIRGVARKRAAEIAHLVGEWMTIPDEEPEGEEDDAGKARLIRLVDEAVAGRLQAPTVDPNDTLTMARRAADALTRENGVPTDDAWLIMRDVKLYKPTIERMHKEALRRIKEAAAAGSTEAPYDHASGVDVRPGQKAKKRAPEVSQRKLTAETVKGAARAAASLFRDKREEGGSERPDPGSKGKGSKKAGHK